MRTHENRAIAGNCGCCIVPFVLLILIALATLVVTALVWHSATRNVFDWGWTHHGHSDAYHAGFQEGRKVGAEYAARGEPEPSDEHLNAIAAREADRSHVRRGRARWIDGFRAGFAHGFESFSKQVFYRPPMPRSLLSAGPPLRNLKRDRDNLLAHAAGPSKSSR